MRAMELFWAKGYERTGVSELLDHLGIARQSLYNTFGNKRQLFLQALDLYGRSATTYLTSTLESPGSPRKRILEALENLEEWASRTNSKGCLFCNTMAEFGATDSEATAVIEKYFQRQEEAYYRAILAGQDRKEFSKELDARGVARMLVNTARGLSLATRHGQNRKGVAKSVVQQARLLLGNQ